MSVTVITPLLAREEGFEATVTCIKDDMNFETLN